MISQSLQPAKIPSYLIVTSRLLDGTELIKTLHRFGSVLIMKPHDALDLLRAAMDRSILIDITDIIVDVTDMGCISVRLCRSIREASKGQFPIIIYSSTQIANAMLMRQQTGATRLLIEGPDIYMGISSLPHSDVAPECQVSAYDNHDGKYVRWGRLELFPERYAAKLDGKSVSLTVSQFNILNYLLARPGYVVSRRQLSLIGVGHHLEKDDRAIDSLLSRVRKQLGEYGWRIQSVRGVGYRWNDQATPDEEVRRSALLSEHDSPASSCSRKRDKSIKPAH